MLFLGGDYPPQEQKFFWFATLAKLIPPTCESESAPLVHCNQAMVKWPENKLAMSLYMADIRGIHVAYHHYATYKELLLEQLKFLCITE